MKKEKEKRTSHAQKSKEAKLMKEKATKGGALRSWEQSKGQRELARRQPNAIPCCVSINESEEAYTYSKQLVLTDSDIDLNGPKQKKNKIVHRVIAQASAFPLFL